MEGAVIGCRTTYDVISGQRSSVAVCWRDQPEWGRYRQMSVLDLWMPGYFPYQARFRATDDAPIIDYRSIRKLFPIWNSFVSDTFEIVYQFPKSMYFLVKCCCWNPIMDEMKHDVFLRAAGAPDAFE